MNPPESEFTYYIPKSDFQQIPSENFLAFYDSTGILSRARLFSSDTPPSIKSIISDPDYTKPLLSRDIYPKSESKRTRTSDLFDVNEAL